MSDPKADATRAALTETGLAPETIEAVMRRRAWRLRRAVLPAPDGPTERLCRTCDETKSLEEFKRHRSKPAGRDYICKPCSAHKQAERLAVDPEYRDKQREATSRWQKANPDRYRARTDDEIAAVRARLRPGATKRCRKCRTLLPFGDFHVSRNMPDGLTSTCKACVVLRPYAIALPMWEELDTWQCIYCGHGFEHVDHVWPVSRGGTDEAHNLVPACAECNLKKNARDVVTWLTEVMPEVIARVSRWSVRVVEDAPTV